MDLFSVETLTALLLPSVSTTIIVSAINNLQTKLSGRWIVAIVSIVITLLQTTYTRGMSLAEWQALLSQFLLTAAFAILFWTYVGQYVVEPFFGWIKKKYLEKYSSTSATPNP